MEIREIDRSEVKGGGYMVTPKDLVRHSIFSEDGGYYDKAAAEDSWTRVLSSSASRSALVRKLLRETASACRHRSAICGRDSG